MAMLFGSPMLCGIPAERIWPEDAPNLPSSPTPNPIFVEHKFSTFPAYQANHSSVMVQCFGLAVHGRCDTITTTSGWSVDQCVQGGLDVPSTPIGLVAGDQESYGMFRPLFDPVILRCHGFDPSKSGNRFTNSAATVLSTGRLKVSTVLDFKFMLSAASSYCRV